MVKFIVPSLLVCLAFIHSGYAFKCYTCDSTSLPECTDGTNVSKFSYGECAASGTSDAACVKYTFQDRAGIMRTMRKCLPYPKGTNACDNQNNRITADEIKHCESCMTDACNSASNIKVSVFALLALGFAVFSQFMRA